MRFIYVKKYKIVINMGRRRLRFNKQPEPTPNIRKGFSGRK
jgi:hypothetical protein